MARFLIYSTGTTWSGTILRTSVTDNPNVGESSLSNEVFVFPEIQPLYLWQVSGVTVIPNTDEKIILYEESIASPPTPQDNINYGEVTGLTETKIDKLTGATGNIPTFTSNGNLQDGGYTIPELTGLTTYTFVGSGDTQIFENGNEITVYSTVPSGTTIAWVDVSDKPSWLSGTTLQDFEEGHEHSQYLTNETFSGYTGTTATELNNKIDKLTGVTNNLAIFDATGNVISGGKILRNDVRIDGVATDGFVTSEKGVRDAIDAAIAATIVLQGDWNATTNTPDLTGGSITTGYAWRVSVSGTTDLDGITDWQVGDLAVKSATGWIKIGNEDVAALWGNIGGTLSDQTDLWNVLTTITGETANKLDTSIFNSYTGTTETRLDGIDDDITGLTATKLDITDFDTYTGATDTRLNGIDDDITGLTATKLDITDFDTYTGATDTRLDGIDSEITYISGVTDTKLDIITFSGYTGTTDTRLDGIDSEITYISGVTDTKLDTDIFTGYTASTANIDKKIQVVSTSTANANEISPFVIPWNSAPLSADTYLWSGGTTVWIKSEGTYEIDYHVVLKNDNRNETHSVGAYVVKNGATELLTATAGMIVGSDNGGELSLPPVVLTLAVNDRLDLVTFRIGNSGNANLVTGSVFMSLNKLS